MKRFSLIVFAMVLLGAGCVQSDEEQRTATSDAPTELWIVRQASYDQIVYQPIEWFWEEAAIAEARADGCTSGCAPSGFYWRYLDDEATQRTWSLEDTSSLRASLWCYQEDCAIDGEGSLIPMSYDEYLAADVQCRANLLDCRYYGIGNGMDFFTPTFSEDGSLSQLSGWNVP